MAANPVTRIRLISFAIFSFSLVLIGRLLFLQVIKNEYYAERADRQYQRPLGQPPDRGIIYFRQQDGNLVSAATMRDGFVAAINPRLLRQPELVHEKLAALLPLDRTSFFQKAGASGDSSYKEIASRLDEEQGAAIKSWKWPGLDVYKTRWRFYPAGRTAAHILGLVNREGAGTYGLEQYYDDSLKREPDKSFTSFFAQMLSDLGGGEARGEADLVLTVEPAVQNALENQLGKLMADWRAESAGGVVLDPYTGEIVALAALPNFDPGGKQESLDNLANPLIERAYEMGSTFKPLTLAAALDAGVITARTTYDDQGHLIINGKIISNYDQRGRGVVSMQEVLNQSLNTGAVFAMQKLGTSRFRDYMIEYGLTEPTGIDLPNEVTGLHRNLESKQEVDYATIAFGQGITVTPIAMTRALAALANGGQLIRPFVVAEIKHRDTKFSRPTESEPGRQALKPETSREITRMLVRVVDTALKGGEYKMPNYSIAAKTGTAQQVGPGGRYDPDRFLHSFFGYFPASQPKFLIFLYLLNPRDAQYAADTLSAPFMSLAKFLLNYYHVPPDR